MPFISEQSVLEVKRSVDIYEIVRTYLPGLKKAGANYKARCPFHEEKTPSFNVHPEKQIYKCFGCGKAGDSISFVMEMEKVDYPDAIRILAERAGIQLDYQDSGKSAGGPRREDLYRVNEWAADVYRKLLATDAGAAARRYLETRGVKDETAETFRLGFSLNEWDGLLSRARKAGFDDRLLHAAGLVLEREQGGGYYDRFRGRLMFPISDARGKVIGFGARAMGDEHPKYINTSETALFSKGRNFYGLHVQKDDLEAQRTVYIVEGYFDVILPYQAGLRGLVATLGTALTRDHLKVLRRYVDRVVLVFDGDEAGKRANERGLDLLLAENMDLFVAPLPPDEDPCDVVVKHSGELLRGMLDQPEEIFEFLVASLRRKHGEATPAAQARVIEDLMERVAQIPDEIKRDLLTKRAAERLNIDERLLRARVRRGAPEPEREPEQPAVSRDDAVGRELLTLLLTRAELAEKIRAAVPAERFPGARAGAVASRAYARPDLAGSDLLALLENAADREWVAGILDVEMEPKDAERRWKACLEYLREREFRATESELRPGLRQAKSDEDANRLLEELVRKRREVPKTRSLPRP